MNKVEKRRTQLAEQHALYPALHNLEEKTLLMSHLQSYFEDEGIATSFYIMPGDVEHLALISDNASEADTILMTHIDTPAYVPFYEHKPLDDQGLAHENRFVKLFFAFVMILLTLPFIWLIRSAWTDGVFNLKDIISFLYLILLLVFFQKNHRGFSRKNNRVRNHSSVIAMMNLAGTLKEDTAFAFIDKGCVNQRGLEKFLDMNELKGKRILYLDSIGSGDASFSPFHDFYISMNALESSRIFAPFKINYRNIKEMNDEEIAQNIVYAEENIQEELYPKEKTAN